MAFFAYFFAHVLKTFEGNFGVAVGLLSFGASITAFLIVQPLAAVALREDKIAVVSAALIPVLLMTCAWNERAMRRHAKLSGVPAATDGVSTARRPQTGRRYKPGTCSSSAENSTSMLCAFRLRNCGCSAPQP